MKASKSSIWILFLFIFILNALYSVWSFAFTDPNLVLTSWPPFWNFQQFMWSMSKQTLTYAYVAIVFGQFFLSVFVSKRAKTFNFDFKHWLIAFFIVTAPLLFSNNALSHDVFNYIFNARMVIKYQMNPHVQVAQHFFYDPWIRFMHNIHTPAPYFYGWTALSLLPYVLGFEKFLLTWLLFRAWSALGLLLTFLIIWLMMKKLHKENRFHFSLLLFNPLLYIELISNSHNDGWLTWPALLSLYLVQPSKKNTKLSFGKIIVSLLLLLLSMSTKYVTILLVPIWLLFVLHASVDKFLNRFHLSVLRAFNLFDLSAFFLFLPLLSARSQQFHPWYLSWSIIFLPLMKNTYAKLALVVLSVSSMLRYVPWLYNGAFEYTPQIEMNEKLITWVPLIIVPIYFLLNRVVLRKTS